MALALLLIGFAVSSVLWARNIRNDYNAESTSLAGSIASPVFYIADGFLFGLMIGHRSGPTSYPALWWAAFVVLVVAALTVAVDPIRDRADRFLARRTH